jgi:AraC-like DNA-binding protein
MGPMAQRSALLHEDILRRLARARESLSDEFSLTQSVDGLARCAGLSEKQFRRLFLQAYGVTPGRFLGRLRIARAKELLARGVSVTEACMGVGFSSLGSFSSKFLRETGRSPRSFQRELYALGAVPVRLVSLYVPRCFLPQTALGSSARDVAF